MRYFHLLVLGLLAVIACSLSVIAMKMPTPGAQAQTRYPGTAPAPALQDPHDLINAKLDQIRRDLAAIERQQASLRQDVATMGQQVSADLSVLKSYRGAWLSGCNAAWLLVADLDGQRLRDFYVAPGHSHCEQLR
jgi:hypothetical protein